MGCPNAFRPQKTGRWWWLAGWLWLVAGAGQAQTLPSAVNVPAGAAADSGQVAPPAVVDSTLLLDFSSRRVGLTTYSLRATLLGRAPAARGAGWQARYAVQADWLGATNQAGGFFVRQETRATLSVRHRWGAARRGFTEPFAQHYQNPATRTAITTLGGRVGWRLALPALAGTPDTGATVQVSLLAGVRRDARRQYADAGPAVGAELLTHYPLPGFFSATAPPLLVAVRAFYATLGPRRFGRVLADALWEAPLPAPAEPGLLRLDVGYRRGRTDDYQASNVQQIRSDTLTAHVAAIWPMLSGITLRSDNTLLLPNRQFAYQAVSGEAATRLRNFGYQQREVRLQQEVRGRWAQWRTAVQFAYTERQRSYDVRAGRLDSTAAQLAAAARQEQLKDIRERTSAWTTNTEWSPVARRPGGGRATLGANTTAQLLRLDTPSPLNDQDRDEVYYQGRLYWNQRWSGTLTTSVAVAAEWRQYIFIKASQSAENYTERVVAYEPGFRWAPGRFAWQADFQLRALYQVRALLTERARDRATRLLRWQQEWSWRLPARADWRLALTYQRRESRFGQLDWARFAEAPLDTTIANDYLFSVRRALPVRAGRPRGLSHAVRLGYRFFEQRVQQRGGLNGPEGLQLIFRHDFTWQHGPEVRYERDLPARGLHLLATAWLQRLSTFTRYRPGEGIFVGVSATPEELARHASRLDPYFDVTLTWRWQ